MLTLVITAVDAERDAVVRDLGPTREVRVGAYAGLCAQTPDGDVHAFSGGVGPVAAAVATSTLLALGPAYDLVVSAGVGGGFDGRAEIGDLVLADVSVAADLGALTDSGHLTLADLGLPGESGFQHADAGLPHRLARGGYRLVSGTVLTLTCMTGTKERAAELAARHPGAVAEAMEGYGVIAATRPTATTRAVATAELRAVSNIIGRRDPATWDLPTAFDTLARAFAALTAPEAA